MARISEDEIVFTIATSQVFDGSEEVGAIDIATVQAGDIECCATIGADQGVIQVSAAAEVLEVDEFAAQAGCAACLQVDGDRSAKAGEVERISAVTRIKVFDLSEVEGIIDIARV